MKFVFILSCERKSGNRVSLANLTHIQKKIFKKWDLDFLSCASPACSRLHPDCRFHMMCPLMFINLFLMHLSNYGWNSPYPLHSLRAAVTGTRCYVLIQQDSFLWFFFGRGACFSCVCLICKWSISWKPPCQTNIVFWVLHCVSFPSSE